jgi:DNA-binding PadR family transcriptional regulator
LLLSLLANGDTLTGYQISSILAEPISLMWPVKHSQIYPALSTLEERGEILGNLVVQTNRPNKKEYGITTVGMERLKTWLLEPRKTLSQDEMRLIAYNLDLLGRDVVAHAMATFRKQCVEEKRQLEGRWPGAWKSPWSDHANRQRMTGMRSVYEHALALRDAQIAWCDEGLNRAEDAVERTQPKR